MPRTIDDWVHLAAAAAGPERAAHLAEAEASAASAWAWRRLLSQAEKHDVGEPGWRLRVAQRLLEAAIRERDTWGFRDAARVRAEHGDPDGARAALEAGAAALDPSGPAYQGVNLARGFVETLGDRAGARRCLDASVAGGLDARCYIATARAELLGERDAAVAILDALTPSEPHEAWTLGNAWQALGEPARALAVFEAALAGASAGRDALTLARAWASHGDAPGRDRALDVAEDLARTAEDWLDLAETAQDLDARDRAVAALTRAEALPLDAVTRPRAAAAWLWLGDAGRADAVGPRGARPDAFAPVVRELPGFTPSASALWDDLRARATDTMLQGIAGADYGTSSDKHLAALLDLVRTGLVPRPLPWEPAEVLRLCRWAEGDAVDHVERALCAALLYLDGDDGHNDPPILVESAVALGEPAATEAEQLLAWRYATAGEDAAEDRFAALWALALLCAARDPDDPRLEALAALAEQEAGASAEGIVRYCVRDALWKELSARWLRPAGATARWHEFVAR